MTDLSRFVESIESGTCNGHERSFTACTNQWHAAGRSITGYRNEPIRLDIEMELTVRDPLIIWM